MNKVQIVINVVLVAAVAALFVIVLSGKKQGETPTAAVEQSEVLPIAYLNTDSLLVNYVFAQEANEKLMKKQEDARLKLNTKARTLQNEMADFQRKLENNAFLSRERAEKEQQRLIKKQQELQELEAKLTEDIMIENQKLNIQLADTLTNFLKEYNADGRYHVILSNNAKDNVLMAAESYNITDEVINKLNARYGK
jgi:outer membrane protein